MDFPFYIVLTLIIIITIVFAKRLKIAYPILLVLVGLVVGFIPGIPSFSLKPEIIFLIFLPPLLYEAAWNVSCKELWRWRRIITGFAFIIVFITAGTVALVAQSFIPGFTLALGFLLGAIVSPPDAVSAGAILKFVKVPRRVASLLEGESLLNDASALIILQFAIIAVVSGEFVMSKAILTFIWMVIGGVGIGILVGYLLIQLHKWLKCDVNINIILSFVAPYIMYIVAEEVGASGVLSVVSGGLFMSARRISYLTASSRLRAINVWDSVILVLNGLVFTIIGLELPDIVKGLQQDGTSIAQAIGYGVFITVVLIITRILSCYGTLGFTLVARRYVRVADSRVPSAKMPLLVSWSGMRGVVSLAAALSVPLYLTDGSAFPYRSLILFITFIVILLTLLIQGLTLPALIRKLNISDPDGNQTEEEEYAHLQKRLDAHTSQFFKEKYKDGASTEQAKKMNEMERDILQQSSEPLDDESKKICIDILKEQRRWLLAVNKEETNLSDEAVRKSLNFIDLKEEKCKYE